MSIGNQAARGAIWSVGSSVGARVVGLIGTLYMTRLLAPEIIGEVSSAAVIAQTVNAMSHVGFNQYMIVHGANSPERTFHVAVVNFAFAMVALCLIAGTGAWFAPLLHAPNLASYLPGLTLAVLIRRLGGIADKVLAREMRFRELAIANGSGELLFTVTAVTLAATTDLGGYAIVIGNILQSLIATTLILRATGWRWLQRFPWQWQRVWEILRFGLPLGLSQVFGFATRYWDNLAFGAFFGQKTVGFYNMAYNLADIPAVQIGEQMAGVLLPAMTNLGPQERKDAVLRSTALMALAVFPLATGLGVIAPTLVALVLSAQWQGVAPLLTVLSVLSVVRPMAWGISAYLASYSRNRAMMLLELLKLVLLFGCIIAFSALGPVWTAASVGIAFGVQSLATITLVLVTDRFPAAPLLGAFVRPLAACAVMVAAVQATRYGLGFVGVNSAILLLPIEIAVGALTYVPAALLFAPATTRDFVKLLRRALKRGG